MKSELSEVELRSTHQLKVFIGEILHLLALHFKGETTLNHLQIGNYIGLISLYEGRPTSNKDIAEKLGMSRSTASRIVADFIDKGWVIERSHPEDGRKKQLLIAPGHPLADNFEKDFRNIFNKILKDFESGKIVRVDPSKSGF